MVDWPETLPKGRIEGTTGGPKSNAAVFNPKRGPSIVRRASTLVVRKRRINLPPLTLEQFATFQTFVHTTLGDGILPFNWVDPFGVPTDGNYPTIRMKFVQNDPLYTEELLPRDQVAVSFEVEIW
jgi:hypothetical protein